MENILSVKGIKKSFGGVHALKGVDLTIRKGETHCLAGENGCGKSTIIKVISGFYKPDGGTIEVDGRDYPVMTPADAIKAGVQVIYQDFSIFPNLTVIENLAFNQVLANGKKFVNKKEFRKIAEEAVAKINFNVDMDVRFSTYGVPMIVGEIRRYLRDNSAIRVSRSMRDTAYKVMQARERLMAQSQREPTVEQLAAELGIPREDVVFAMDAIVDPVSLFEPVYSDGGDTVCVMDQVKDVKNTDEQWLEHIALKDALDRLGEREKHILALRFYEGKTQMEVSAEVGISQAQVSRLEKNALKTIKKNI